MSLPVNKRARYDYNILAEYVAGIVLSGAEVKSLRSGAGSLTGSFVQIVGGEAVLLNAQINAYQYASDPDYEPKRTRKLLLHKKEIYTLAAKVSQQGLTLVPLRFFLQGRQIKLAFGLGRGKKRFEKRAQIKARDLERELAREI